MASAEAGTAAASEKRMWLLRKRALLWNLKENVASAEAGTAAAVGSRETGSCWEQALLRQWEVEIQALHLK